jgi:acyl-CoA thioester hydrolase
MSLYQKTIAVKEDDLDDLNHVNNVRYVQWIQDISKEHWQNKAPQKAQDEFIWVVLTHHITYKSSAVLNDRILLTTHIEKSEGAKSIRVVEMLNDKTKDLIVRSVTEWCLLKKSTLRPMRISEDIKQIFS